MKHLVVSVEQLPRLNSALDDMDLKVVPLGAWGQVDSIIEQMIEEVGNHVLELKDIYKEAATHYPPLAKEIDEIAILSLNLLNHLSTYRQRHGV